MPKLDVRTFGRKPTPQEKMIAVNNRAGNRGIQNQQGSTRALYHTIPLNAGAPQTEFEFFKSIPQGAAKWVSNVDSINGLLGPGETLTLQDVMFSCLVIETATGEVLDVTTISAISAVNTLSNSFYTGTWEADISNSKVLKPTATQVFLPAFNPTMASSLLLELFTLDTDLVIMPALPFVITLRIPVWSLTPAAGTTNWIRCTIMGPCSILNLKQTV